MMSWINILRFNALPIEKRSIVFYAENEDSWRHFESTITFLTEEMNLSLTYITSDRKDPILSVKRPNLYSFYIGTKGAKTFFFYGLNARTLVMTMPDLDTMHVKRSRLYPVHYIYIFHSMVSTHMIYRKEAFNQFDTICCVGPHHIAEIRAAEKQYQLKEKNLQPCGYGYLDTIFKSKCTNSSHKGIRNVLVAPSWGPEALLETCGEQLVHTLLKANYSVTVRPHPRTASHSPHIIDNIARRFSNHERFKLDTATDSIPAFQEADLLISDWSGAALEFAFGYEKLVLYLDVPRKVNNPHYDELTPVPLEVSIREEIGALVPLHEVGTLPKYIDHLSNDYARYQTQIRILRDKYVYHHGYSGQHMARLIAQLAPTKPRLKDSVKGRSSDLLTSDSTGA